MFTVESFDPRDAERVYGWVGRGMATILWGGTTIGGDREITLNQFQTHLSRTEEQGRKACLCRDASGEPAGYFEIAAHEGGRLHLGRLVLNPSFRGQGRGRGFMDAILTQTGTGLVTLNVYRENPAAAALYSHSFLPVAVRRDDVLTSITMVRHEAAGLLPREGCRVQALLREEVAALKPLWEQLSEHHGRRSQFHSGHFRTLSFETRIGKLPAGPLQLISVRCDDSDAGYIISSHDGGGKGEIDSLFVTPLYRKKGIGDLLMKLSLCWFDINSVRTRHIVVAEGNEAVFPFYERYGFRLRSHLLESSGAGSKSD